MAYVVAEALEACGIPFVFATGYDQETIPKCYARVRFFGKPIVGKPIVAGQVAEALLA